MQFKVNNCFSNHGYLRDIHMIWPEQIHQGKKIIDLYDKELVK